MLQTPLEIELPQYCSAQTRGLPTKATPWPLKHKELRSEQDVYAVLKRCADISPWQWPEQPVYFIADPHADAEAFTASLIASGGIGNTFGHRF